MKCPVCGATLLMSERHGVEIDYCPECRGIWLDRGELDKIIERAAEESGMGSTPKEKHGGHQPAPEYKKRKSSVLSDIMDIFGGE